MRRYALAYRLGLTPWERYATTARQSIGAMLDREEAERSRPLGRALDLGCGRGRYTCELAGRGGQAMGIDNIPRAIEAANRGGVPDATFVVGRGRRSRQHWWAGRCSPSTPRTRPGSDGR
jgi:SAM-dependent methyltransferase